MFKKNKRGVVTFWIIFIMLAIYIIFITAVMAPFGVLVNTEFYAIGESIMLDANETTSQIQDPTIRQKYQDTIESGLSGIDNNIVVNNSIFKYGFIVVLVVVALFLFLYARRLVETGYGFV